jgi:hypothetical protein
MMPLEPVIAQVESPGAKPEPVTLTLVPLLPLLGLRVTVGMVKVTWNAAVAESPIGPPIAETE